MSSVYIILGSQGECQSFFLTVLGLDFFQLKIIHMPKRHSGVMFHSSTLCIAVPSSLELKTGDIHDFSFQGAGWKEWLFRVVLAPSLASVASRLDHR